MYERLVVIYGPQQWWPAHSRFEMIVGAYLTQNTSWKGVERSIQNLAAHSVLNLDGVAASAKTPFANSSALPTT
jgi:endonuclease III related protein